MEQPAKQSLEPAGIDPSEMRFSELINEATESGEAAELTKVDIDVARAIVRERITSPKNGK